MAELNITKDQLFPTNKHLLLILKCFNKRSIAKKKCLAVRQWPASSQYMFN